MLPFLIKQFSYMYQIKSHSACLIAIISDCLTSCFTQIYVSVQNSLSIFLRHPIQRQSFKTALVIQSSSQAKLVCQSSKCNTLAWLLHCGICTVYLGNQELLVLTLLRQKEVFLRIKTLSKFRQFLYMCIVMCEKAILQKV